MEENVATRLKLFIDTNGLSSTQFADMCGIPRPTLSQILSGRNKKISDILVGQIHRSFPDLSILWLLFGEGPVKTSAGFRTSSNSEERDSFSNDQAQDGAQRRPGNDSSGVIGDEIGNFGSSNSFQNPVAPGNGVRGFTNENLMPLKDRENDPNIHKNQVFESDLKIMDLRRQIEQMRQNPRKVVQITIYYDDSTFETFIPKG